MRDLLTTIFVGAVSSLALTTAARAADQAPADRPEQVIQPELDRRAIKVPRIDTEDFEIGVFAGVLSVENFGAQSVSGVRLAYHVSEDFFLEATYGRSTISDQDFFDLGLALFPNREEDLNYYNLSLGINLFPGEVFIGKGWAMTSAVYLIGGVGNTDFISGSRTSGNQVREDKFTFNFGVGIRVLPTDWLAVHVDVRDHVFETDILGANKYTNNFELTGGITVFF